MFILPFLSPVTPVTPVTPTRRAHLLLLGGSLWEEDIALEDITTHVLEPNGFHALHLHYDPIKHIVFCKLDPHTPLEDYYRWTELPVDDERFAWRTFYDLDGVPPTETLGPFALHEILHDVFKPDAR